MNMQLYTIFAFTKQYTIYHNVATRKHPHLVILTDNLDIFLCSEIAELEAPLFFYLTHLIFCLLVNSSIFNVFKHSNLFFFPITYSSIIIWGLQDATLFFLSLFPSPPTLSCTSSFLILPNHYTLIILLHNHMSTLSRHFQIIFYCPCFTVIFYSHSKYNV